MIEAARLKQLASLWGFEDDDYHALAPLLTEKRLAAGDSVWSETTHRECLSLVLEGKVELSMATEFPERRVVMGLFSAGTIIGEIGAFTGSETKLTATAMELTIVAILPTIELKKLSSESHPTYMKLILSVLTLTSKRLLQAYERMSSVF